MPIFYAHHHFGEQVYKELPEGLQEIVYEYYPQFQIGLQGPDIFFFYRSSESRVAKYGHELHAISAYPFFQNALKVIREKGRTSPEYAYLIGYICHFILDSESHPYVNNCVTRLNVPHLEIEQEFDKYMMRIDKLDPFHYPTYDLVPTDNLTAKTIYPFFEHIDPTTAQKALEDLKSVRKALNSPNRLQTLTVSTSMKFLKRHDEYKAYIPQHKDNPVCRETNIGLMKRFNTSLSTAIEMIKDFDNSVQNRKALNRRFNWTFGSN